ncbi:MAG: hypothetical protein JNN30_12475 [Rhodanobacteraceae bacterium]|nr:hypothetical protein [Rhodanobacteraceae bacterium]
MMTHRIRRATCGLIASIALTGWTAVQATEVPSWPDWMAGSWCGGHGETHVEEVWLRSGGGLMLGMSRTTDPYRNEFEHLRIELQGSHLVYQAQPQGRPAVPFTRGRHGPDFVEFDNPQHDFPQRIRYQREGDQLRAEISGPGRDGQTKSIPFHYRACALNGG